MPLSVSSLESSWEFSSSSRQLFCIDIATLYVSVAGDAGDTGGLTVRRAQRHLQRGPLTNSPRPPMLQRLNRLLKGRLRRE